MDIERLLRSLSAHRARFVIIGATAFPVHGYARATLDVDLLIEDTPENAAHLILMKEAVAGRPKDIEDLRALQRLRRKGGHS